MINSGAIRIGKTMARLLNGGFPLQAALEIAQGESIIGGNYLVVGDGSLSVAQSESGIALLAIVDSTENSFTLQLKSYPTANSEMGSILIPCSDIGDKYSLGSGNTEAIDVSKAEALSS
ncbi:hypothetical protein [Haladaptatus sp. NG-SE-30]